MSVCGVISVLFIEKYRNLNRLLLIIRLFCGRGVFVELTSPLPVQLIDVCVCVFVLSRVLPRK